MRDSDRQPFGNMRFRLEIENLSGTGAVEVIFPEARLPAPPRPKPVVEYGVLTVRRGLTGSSEWYDWWDTARTSPAKATRSIAVVLLDQSGADAHRWTFSGVQPRGYLLSPLNALGNAPLIESLELAVGRFEASFGSSRASRRTRR
jgi:hypothetical protein